MSRPRRATCRRPSSTCARSPDRLREDGLAGHELLVLLDLVRLSTAAAPVGPTCTDGGRRTVAQRLAELSEQVDGVLPPLVARFGRAAVDGSPDALLAVADDFAGRELTVYAAEATALALHRTRHLRAGATGPIRERLADLLRRCDEISTRRCGWLLRPTLSDREWEIARLAADGVTSRAIAERLFLSTRTVENHLQRVYSKLGVAGRGELRAALRSMPGHDGADPG
ncbi:LuxR family transcriptional regulator [Micromonospora sp. b486]|uniref:helix-turn-helix transcriptional regulator n=1 Tax=Micromonospora sp. b486 TaxID=3053986 RepID=UPI00259CC24C|nr:LuxR family transcriptional regulator [Micromonospora sp. b486]MDM4784561.1 LuxR C-terminal-related transcriptional regulator [Micromonospora sp. b486]